jgi:hypothetical protein
VSGFRVLQVSSKSANTHFHHDQNLTYTSLLKFLITIISWGCIQFLFIILIIHWGLWNNENGRCFSFSFSNFFFSNSWNHGCFNFEIFKYLQLRVTNNNILTQTNIVSLVVISWVVTMTIVAQAKVKLYCLPFWSSLSPLSQWVHFLFKLFWQGFTTELIATTDFIFLN